jgi:hypothetical protein
MNNEEFKCEHCGKICEDEWELDVMHRGCRLKAAFPDAYRKEGGLLIFDMEKIREKLGE